MVIDRISHTTEKSFHFRQSKIGFAWGHLGCFCFYSECLGISSSTSSSSIRVRYTIGILRAEFGLNSAGRGPRGECCQMMLGHRRCKTGQKRHLPHHTQQVLHALGMATPQCTYLHNSYCWPIFMILKLNLRGIVALFF